MKFVAVDVETANADLASICQIGVVSFSDKKVDETWESLVNPEDEFDEVNVSIHGINEDMVASAPILPHVFDELRSRLEGKIVVSHMPFDRIALTQVSEKYSLPKLDCTWLDSARVARRTWTQFAHSGYGLSNLAEELGIEFKHHNALEDARAAGEIINKAIEESGMDINGWLERVGKPIFNTVGYSEKIKRNGNPEGHLFGEVVVFTGELLIPRKQAVDAASQVGCQVDPSVTQSTSILVVGNQDVRRLAGHEKSSKHRKAETLILKGQQIRILTEDDFMRLIQ